jgi:hypothetical protein
MHPPLNLSSTARKRWSNTCSDNWSNFYVCDSWLVISQGADIKGKKKGLNDCLHDLAKFTFEAQTKSLHTRLDDWRSSPWTLYINISGYGDMSRLPVSQLCPLLVWPPNLGRRCMSLLRLESAFHCDRNKIATTSTNSNTTCPSNSSREVCATQGSSTGHSCSQSLLSSFSVFRISMAGGLC